MLVISKPHREYLINILYQLLKSRQYFELSTKCKKTSFQIYVFNPEMHINRYVTLSDHMITVGIKPNKNGGMLASERGLA